MRWDGGPRPSHRAGGRWVSWPWRGGGGVWAVGKLSWLGPAFPWPAPLCHQLLRQLSVVAVGIWLLPSITNLHLLQSRSLKLV